MQIHINARTLKERLKISIAQFPVEKQIHCLRHFNVPESDELSDLAIKLSITTEDLKSYYNIAGSKFHKSFAVDPFTCFKRLREELRFSKISQGRKNVLIAEFRFSKSLFPYGIGFSNIISTEELADEEKKGIKQIERDGIKVNILKTDIKFITWQANLVVEIDPAPTVLTLFPGESAPALPDTRYLEGEELEKSIKFWAQHVFLEA